MLEQEATVRNKLGIHARPSAILVQTATGFRSEITLIRDDLKVNGKSIMGVMMLAAEEGAAIVVRAEGPDEADALKGMVAAIQSSFD
jgi:phosphocarrier protein HPr